LIRDNQAVYAEDLPVAWLARLAKSVHDAGWAQLVRLLQEKPAHYGRSVVKVSRWFPSRRLCSEYGLDSGEEPLSDVCVRGRA
jgi:putative transposase